MIWTQAELRLAADIAAQAARWADHHRDDALASQLRDRAHEFKLLSEDADPNPVPRKGRCLECGVPDYTNFMMDNSEHGSLPWPCLRCGVPLTA